MRWLITGAGGSSAAAAERLRESGEEVVGVDRRRTRGSDRRRRHLRPGTGSRRPRAPASSSTRRRWSACRATSRAFGQSTCSGRGLRWRLHATPARRFLQISSVVTFGLDFPDGVAETHPVRRPGSHTSTRRSPPSSSSCSACAPASRRRRSSARGTSTGLPRGPGRCCPWNHEGGPLRAPGARARDPQPGLRRRPGRGDHRRRAGRAAAGRVITLSGGVGVRHGTTSAASPMPPAKCVLPTPLAMAGARAPTRPAVSGKNELTPDGVRYLADAMAPTGSRPRGSCSVGSRSWSWPRAWIAPSPGCGTPVSSDAPANIRSCGGTTSQLSATTTDGSPG